MCEALKGADSRVEERHGRIEDSMDPFMVHILRDKVREYIRGSTPVKGAKPSFDEKYNKTLY